MRSTAMGRSFLSLAPYLAWIVADIGLLIVSLTPLPASALSSNEASLRPATTTAVELIYYRRHYYRGYYHRPYYRRYYYYRPYYRPYYYRPYHYRRYYRPYYAPYYRHYF
jgi:hypothetical protein